MDQRMYRAQLIEYMEAQAGVKRRTRVDPNNLPGLAAMGVTVRKVVQKPT